MQKVEEVKKFGEATEAHLARYVANRTKRTGQEWKVARRYSTVTIHFMSDSTPFSGHCYKRAVVIAGVKEVRIYYLSRKNCWTVAT